MSQVVTRQTSSVATPAYLWLQFDDLVRGMQKAITRNDRATTKAAQQQSTQSKQSDPMRVLILIVAFLGTVSAFAPSGIKSTNKSVRFAKCSVSMCDRFDANEFHFFPCESTNSPARRLKCSVRMQSRPFYRWTSRRWVNSCLD